MSSRRALHVTHVTHVLRHIRHTRRIRHIRYQVVYDEFAPFEMLQHASKALRRFGTFSEAVDEFFSQLEAQRAQQAYEAQQNAAWKKVDKIRNAQEGRVDGLRSKEAADMQKARLVEGHVAELDALLALLRNGVANGMDWEEVRRK